MAAPLVSIIIPTYGRPQALEACLDSIEATVHHDHEVVCVSVRGDEDTRAALAGRDVRHLAQPLRGGCVQAGNMGLRAASGTYVTVLNDDCTLLPHAIQNAVEFLEAPAHDRLGQAAFFHDTPARRNVYAQVEIDDVPYRVLHVRGLCYANFGLARRALYRRLNYLDERYFMYGADPDFSLKVWHEARLAVTPCPGALVHHAHLEDERASRERPWQDEDNLKLFDKWRLNGARRP